MTGEWPNEGRLAGIDYGSVRIGVAVTDPGRILASPHDNYTRRGEQEDAAYFRQLVRDERIGGFVVGLPVHASGLESQKSLEARRFGSWLGQVTGIPVRYFDERYTTAAAERLLLEAGLTRKGRKQRRDMLAAQVILTAFLESAHGGAEPPGSLDDEGGR